MKHTLGPWHAVEYGGKWAIQKENFYSDSDDLLDEEYCKNATANAKLVASAPELLEALKEMVRMYKKVQPAGGWQGVYEGAVHAIEKATK